MKLKSGEKGSGRGRDKPGFNKYSLVEVVAPSDLIENCACKIFPCTSPMKNVNIKWEGRGGRVGLGDPHQGGERGREGGGRREGEGRYSFHFYFSLYDIPERIFLESRLLEPSCFGSLISGPLLAMPVIKRYNL